MKLNEQEKKMLMTVKNNDLEMLLSLQDALKKENLKSRMVEVWVDYLIRSNKTLSEALELLIEVKND